MAGLVSGPARDSLPLQKIFRHPEPVLEPELDYELHGEVNEVVFATNICEIGGTFYIYYEAADKVVCGATVEKVEIMAEHNYKLAKRFYSYENLKRKLRFLLTDFFGEE
ncbi:MAG: hypothetical protein JRJ03_07960 [Deltaproteobacteria bacterium]|nr:hypothetical protein [Deltaproteobacteria bacterium]